MKFINYLVLLALLLPIISSAQSLQQYTGITLFEHHTLYQLTAEQSFGDLSAYDLVQHKHLNPITLDGATTDDLDMVEKAQNSSQQTKFGFASGNQTQFVVLQNVDFNTIWSVDDVKDLYDAGSKVTEIDSVFQGMVVAAKIRNSSQYVLIHINSVLINSGASSPWDVNFVFNYKSGEYVGSTSVVEEVVVKTKLYPRVVADGFITFEFLDTEAKKIFVYNIEGKLVYEAHQVVSETATLDMSAVQNGLYIISVESGGAFETFKVVKI